MNKYLYIPALLTLLAACNPNHELSDAYGNFEATTYMISSKVNGQLLDMKAQEGSKTKKGALLAVIDTTALKLQIDQLKAKQKAIQSKTEQIKAQTAIHQEQKTVLLREKKRTTRLLQKGAATQKQLDDIKGKIDVTNAQIKATRTQLAGINAEIESLEAQINIIKDQLSDCYIKAPANGVILETYPETHELVLSGKPICKIANLNKIILRAYVDGKTLPAVQLGQKVEVLIDDPQQGTKSYEGTISWIAEEAEFTPKIIQTKEERVNLVYAIKVKVKNDGHIKIGMPGEIKL